MNQPPSPDPWDPCPPGALEQAAGRITARRRQAILRRTAVVAVSVLLLAAAAWAVRPFLGSAEQHFGQIACSEVRLLLGDYAGGKLDAELSRRIRLHLEQCLECGPLYRRMQPVGMSAAWRVADRSWKCACPACGASGARNRKT